MPQLRSPVGIYRQLVGTAKTRVNCVTGGVTSFAAF